MTDHRTPTSDPQPVELGRWYPDMPPGLPGETDEQYTDRLTGADGTGRRPYDHRRFRQCSIGYHDECSRLRTGDEGCQCPCHSVTPTSDAVAEDLPLVPGGSDRDAVVAWFTGCMDGSSAAQRATTILDSLLAQERQQARAAFAARVAATWAWAHEFIGYMPGPYRDDPDALVKQFDAFLTDMQSNLAASPEPASPEPWNDAEVQAWLLRLTNHSGATAEVRDAALVLHDWIKP